MLPGSEPVSLPLAENWQVLKNAIKGFESAWRQDSRPAIDDYLPIDNALRSRVLIELVHIDLELRLKAGEAARIEGYLDRYPELTQDRTIHLKLIAAEHALRHRRDPDLTFDEYLQRFPQLRAEPLGQIIQEMNKGLDADAPRAPSRTAADILPEVEGYEVLGLLGRGGMGAVYKARQHRLDRLVALKFLPEECMRDPVWLARFRREARTASALNHPYICTIFDTGESAGRPYLSMELVEGHTLEDLIVNRRPIEEVAQLLGQAAQALAAAHAAGIVHRDVKPANLMVRLDGILKVLDFGLARQLHSRLPQSPTTWGKSTDPGTRVGTSRYMSPEQARAEPVDSATDIFSLGMVMYELTTGRHPFSADSEVGVLHAIISLEPTPPTRLNPEIPIPLEALIQHMLSKDPRLRPTAVEVEAELTQLRVKPSTGSGTPHAASRRRPMVGRQKEWAFLRTGFEEAVAGRGSLICVTGEPGLGKTTLVESFLEELVASRRTMRVARGRCSERLAGTEAYLPFLEALDSLMQGEGGASAAQEMKTLAPSWYVQLAPLVADEPSLTLALAEANQGSQERGKRELAVFLREMSRRRPMVIFLDDVHWADPSSVDLLAYLGARCSEWRLLIVVTYRPSDLLRSQHPFGPVKLELQGRGVSREIALPFLVCDDLSHYLKLAFEGHHFPEQFAAVLHTRTEGNPLFVVDLLHYLRDSGVIVQNQGHWTLAQAVTNLQRHLPESVRGMIQRKIDQLNTADRQLLMAASVQGPEFDSAVVARLLGREAADVEERLNVLERVHYLVQIIREHVFPDGTLTVRYGFVHALYQDALHAALQPTRKAAWSAAAANALLGHYGEKSTGLAAELAMLFEAARDHEHAADYYLTAADNAARIFAHHESVGLARRGLALLQTLPDTPQRAECELPLLVTLGMQLQVSQGFAVPEAQRLYERARALCEHFQGAAPLFPVLWGLWMFYEVRGEPRKSLDLAEQLFSLASDAGQLLQAHQALAITSLCLGDPEEAREHMEQGVALADAQQPSTFTYLYGQDPKVGCLAFGAIALWLLGYPDRALKCGREALELAEKLGQPSTQALALHFLAMLRQYRREGPAVRENAEAQLTLAIEQRLSFWKASGLIFGGWAMAQHGSAAPGVAQMRQGMAAFEGTGAHTYHSYYRAVLAEGLGWERQFEQALRVLAEGLALTNATGEGFHAAELFRLQGEFLLQQGGGGAVASQAESCFQQALSIASGQQAKSLELRAAMSLTRLYERQGRKSEALPILAECYAWFTEGFDTPDLKDAQALLQQVA